MSPLHCHRVGALSHALSHALDRGVIGGLPSLGVEVEEDVVGHQVLMSQEGKCLACTDSLLAASSYPTYWSV